MFSVKKGLNSIVAGYIISFGIQAFALGNTNIDDSKYLKSLGQYQQQYKKNSSDTINLYNLAVINYKLKKYQQAKVYFLELLPHDNYHLIAKYNLGLVSYKLGNKKEAIKWFKSISSHEHEFKISEKLSTNIIKLANRQLLKLATLKPIKSKKRKPATLLKSYLFAYYGHDDSLEDPDPVGSAAPEDDFLNVYGLLTVNLDQLLFDGMKWRASYYSKKYSFFNNYDFTLTSTDFTQHIERVNWKSFIRLAFDQSTYGVTDYQSIIRLDLKSQYKYTSHKLAARYRYDDIVSGDILYDAYGGDQHRLDIAYSHSFKPHKIQLVLGLEVNDRTDQVSGAVFQRSLSPEHKKIGFIWSYRISNNFKARLKYEYRDSLYKDINFLDNNTLRDETRSLSSFRLKYRLHRTWWLSSEIALQDNQSNISNYTYTKNVIKVGVTGSF